MARTPRARADLNLLLVLDAILQTRSVTAAAKRLGITKAAMSHALARVRERVGDPILVRAGKEWALTERARQMAERVHETATAAQALLDPPGLFDPSTSKMEFRIRATDHGLAVIGVEIERAVAAEAPHVTLRFTPALPDDVPALRDGAVDIALGVFPALPPAFRTQTLFEERLACVVRRGHPQVSASGRLTLKRFLALDHILVAPRGAPGGFVDDALRARGLRRRVHRLVPYFVTALDFVSRTDAIVTISERLAVAHAARFDLQVLAPPIALPTYTISQVWHPRTDMDEAHVWLRQLIARLASTLGRGRGRG
jgi:DNA-binding transcriptional LysR family regulator